MLKANATDGTVVGFILGRSRPYGEAEIYNIGTTPQTRREGIGSMLLEEFRVICARNKASSIWLEVRVSNQTAIDFYQSNGFKRKGIRTNFYSNPTEDAELMCLSGRKLTSSKL